MGLESFRKAASSPEWLRFIGVLSSYLGLAQPGTRLKYCRWPLSKSVMSLNLVF